MENDLGAMLESVLSDPAQMEKIASMAQSFMGSAAQTPEKGENSSSKNIQDVFSEQNGGVFSLLGKAFSSGHPKSRSTQLLLAMRPYMRSEKQEKLDRAIKIAEIVHIAGFVMKEYGGDFFGGV